MPDTDEYLSFAKALAVEAGAIIKQNFASGMKKEWKDEDSSPVTETDYAINRLVIDKISAAYPGHGVHGEEESKSSDSDFKWICDPVDGTMPFSHGLPISTFSLALTYKGESIVGVVYDPYFERLFSASKGKGAFLNGNKIEVNNQVFKNALIEVETEFAGNSPILQLDGLGTELFKQGAHTVRLWSVILPSVLIANGDISGAIFNLPKPEDAAAVAVIVTEAGGKVTDLFGDTQNYDGPTRGFIASNGVIHDQLVEIIGRLHGKNNKNDG